MFKILAFYFFSSVFAKLENPTDDYIFHEWFNNLEEYRNLKTTVRDVDAWVLSLSRDVDALRLRQVSGEEVLEVFGAQLDDGARQRQPSANKTRRRSTRPAPKIDEKAMLIEIMRVINKFVMAMQNEAEVNIDDADKGIPTIKLYFKGALTSLVVRVEGRAWHYIIRHSPFPEWFYEEHAPESDAIGPYVDVPKSVTSEFYYALFHYLTILFGFPV